jgi:gamma-glutamylcyclotransferase (GGCT)/AIG2-like uncharacterized protein YtfP
VGTDAPLRFFFYGTLIRGSANSAARAAHRALRDLGPAQVAGALYAIPDPGGWYPALLSGGGVVHGRLYEVLAGFGAADLAALDAYEDYDPANPASSLYLRIALANGAYAYRFNHPLPAAARPIPSGDFATWIAAEGLMPFGG